MKRTVRILAVVLAFVMLLALAGCGAKSKIKGEWVGDIMGMELTMDFDGKEVTMTIMGESESTEYEFKGDKLYIDGDEVDYEFDGKDKLILDMEELGELELERK